jgi:hypothetical protein
MRRRRSKERRAGYQWRTCPSAGVGQSGAYPLDAGLGIALPQPLTLLGGLVVVLAIVLALGSQPLVPDAEQAI